jgi:mannose-6-phosphate isomerase-like protein (cupin superfamily)
MTTVEWLIIIGLILAGIPAVTLALVLVGQFWLYRPWRKLDMAVARLSSLSSQQDPHLTMADFRAVARSLAAKDIKIASPEAEMLMKTLTSSGGATATGMRSVPPWVGQMFADMDWSRAPVPEDPPVPKGFEVRKLSRPGGVTVLKLQTTGIGGPTEIKPPDQYHIITVVSGSLGVDLPDKKHTVQPNRYIVVPPGVSHKVWSLEKTESYAYNVPPELYRESDFDTGS